jgi:hypothetical protein
MPGILTLDCAAELAATLAHTSVLVGVEGAGYPAFATLTPHLTETNRRRCWSSMLEAATRQFELDDPRTGVAAALDLLDNALAGGDSAIGMLDMDAELFCTIEPADRPGENDNEGYDIMALTLDLSTRWDAELVRRALAAVDPGHGTATP